MGNSSLFRRHPVTGVLEIRNSGSCSNASICLDGSACAPAPSRDANGQYASGRLRRWVDTRRVGAGPTRRWSWSALVLIGHVSGSVSGCLRRGAGPAGCRASIETQGGAAGGGGGHQSYFYLIIIIIIIILSLRLPLPLYYPISNQYETGGMHITGVQHGPEKGPVQ